MSTARKCSVGNLCYSNTGNLHVSRNIFKWYKVWIEAEVQHCKFYTLN